MALPYPYFGFKNISIYLSFNETNLIGIFKKSAIFLAGSLLYISISSSFITEYSKPVINLIARTSIFSLLSIAPASELSNPPDKSKIALAFLFILFPIILFFNSFNIYSTESVAMLNLVNPAFFTLSITDIKI